MLKLHKPKDFGDGILEGVSVLGKGVAAGVGVLVAAPIAGATQQGGWGLVKGLGAGVLGAAALSAAGVAGAAVQITRGVGSQVDAWEAGPGQEWDEVSSAVEDDSCLFWCDGYGCLQEQRKWVDHVPYFLHEACQAVLDEPDEQLKDKSGSGRREVKEMEFYELLGVPVD
eukprot:SAG31_NODE_13410_length_871_cov_1.125648_2_plen_169_part_01